MIYVAELSFNLALLIDTFPNTYMLNILCCTPVERMQHKICALRG